MGSFEDFEMKPIIAWRVRVISCDGGLPGRAWVERFFLRKDAADKRMLEIIEDSNIRNPKYPYGAHEENLEGIVGYCNWQFGIMVTVDSIEIK